MTGYTFSISCKACGGDLSHVNGTTHAGTEAIAIAKCTRCSREWSVSVHLRPAPLPRSVERRGTREKVPA